ncbi:MAG: hypothetical protein ACOYCE_07220 [Limnochordia bacterium]
MNAPNTILVIILLLLLSMPASAQVIVVSVDAMDLDEMASSQLPGLAKWLETGAVGLMNCRTAGRSNPTNGALSLGAGVRARTGTLGGLSFNEGEESDGVAVDELARHLIGRIPPPGSIVHLALSQTIAANQGLGYDVEVGVLGDVLREKGIRTWTLGSGDTPGTYLRSGVLVAIDSNGLVAGGDVGRTLLVRDDPDWPYGWRTDYQALAAALREGLDKAEFLVVDLGDLARLESYRELFLPRQLEAFRRLAMVHVDDFLKQLWSLTLSRDALVIILAPSPTAASAQRNHLLTPIIVHSPKHQGLLSSPTTRREGLVTNMDFAPTVLEWFRVAAPSSLPGGPMASTPHPDPLGTLRGMWVRMKATYDQRLPILKNYVIVQIPVYLGVVLLLWTAKIPSPFVLVLKVLLLSLMAVPLVLLLMNVQGNLTITAAILVLGSLGLGVLMGGLSRGKGFVALALLTAGLIAWDLLMGSSRLSQSLLGYDPIVGARFYGIGNEYMGVFLSSVLVGMTGLFDLSPRLAKVRSLIGFMVAVGVIFLLSSPRLGANVGGTMAAVVSLGWIWWHLTGKPFTWRGGLLILLCLILVLGIAFWIDSREKNSPSHLGRTVWLMSSRGPRALLEIARRKIMFNLRLMRYTYWTRALVTSVGVLAFLSIKPPPRAQRIDGHHPYLALGVRAAIIAGAAALVCNDSGVVAAATSLIPVVPTLLYLAMIHA